MNKQKIILDVRPVLELKIGGSLKYKIDQKIGVLDKETRVANRVKGEVVLNHSQRNSLIGFFVLKTVLELTCARCLKKFKKETNLSYEQKFTFQKEDDTFPILPSKTINILPSIKQELLLLVPIMPICNPKCKGIKTF